jgi:hypothetical protein
MESVTSFFAVFTGLSLRLAIPIVVTVVLISLMRKLDAQWQSEAQASTLRVEKPKCWEIKGCSPEQMKNCIAVKSSLPCWQTYRLPNGHLREECLSCEVFRKAPIPA